MRKEQYIAEISKLVAMMVIEEDMSKRAVLQIEILDNIKHMTEGTTLKIPDFGGAKCDIPMSPIERK